MTLQTANMNTLWGSLIVEELIRNKVSLFFISPGSRSTPLTVAAARNENAKIKIFYDERAAAFYALGYGRATGRAAALICTSGTAAANYFPAVIEASKDCIPLIILSADRPPELQDTGANQTIQQTSIFGNYPRWQYEFPCPDEKVPPETVLTTIDQLVYRAQTSPPGPVHLNCMFREPLAPEKVEIADGYLKNLTFWRNSKKEYTRYAKKISQPPEHTLDDIFDLLKTSKKGFVIIGRLNSEPERLAVLKLVEVLNWPWSADISSQLRLGTKSDTFIPYFDLLLTSDQFRAQFNPDTVLQIGGQFVSKRLTQFISSCRPENYLVVRDDPYRYDPTHSVSLRIEANIPDFCTKVLASLKNKKESDWIKSLKSESELAAKIIKNFLKESDELNEPAVAETVSSVIPGNWALFLASSLPVREMDQFAASDGRPVTVRVNRGASGIDGTLASALGFSMGLRKPVVLLTGDLALLHDLNSLHLIEKHDFPVVIVLFNNRGGGIFSFLPIANYSDVFEQYFSTPHNLSFQFAAQQFGLKYFVPENMKQFYSVFKSATEAGKSILIEVNIDKDETLALHKKLITRLQDV